MFKILASSRENASKKKKMAYTTEQSSRRSIAAENDPHISSYQQTFSTEGIMKTCATGKSNCSSSSCSGSIKRIKLTRAKWKSSASQREATRPRRPPYGCVQCRARRKQQRSCHSMRGLREAGTPIFFRSNKKTFLPFGQVAYSDCHPEPHLNNQIVWGLCVR